MNVELLRELSNTPGIPGAEQDVQRIVSRELVGRCDEVGTDRLGNVIGLRRGTVGTEAARRPRVALVAHADEIGMVVKHVDDRGYIHFEAVGALHAPSIVSQPVAILGRTRVLGAVVPDRKQPREVPELSDLLIDVGLPAPAVAELVEIGDPIVFTQELVRINEDVFMGRNFDDRLGTYVLLETMRRAGPTAVDVYAVSSVQEEPGVRGMPVAAYAIEPDVGIAIDGSPCQSAYSRPHDETCRLGEGTGIYVLDRLTVPDRRLVSFLVDVCTRHAIPYQRNVGGGTDASALQRTGLGAAVTTVGAPVRYMHSTVQLCHARDVEATIELLARFLEHAHEFLTPEGDR
jgi:endoglucanase